MERVIQKSSLREIMEKHRVGSIAPGSTISRKALGQCDFCRVVLPLFLFLFNTWFLLCIISPCLLNWPLQRALKKTSFSLFRRGWAEKSTGVRDATWLYGSAEVSRGISRPFSTARAREDCAGRDKKRSVLIFLRHLVFLLRLTFSTNAA